MALYTTDSTRVGNHPFSLGWDSEGDIIIRAGCRHLFGLGARAVEEALLELAHSPLGPCPVLDVLARYRRLTPALVAAVGADHSFRAQLLVVPA